MSNSPTQTTTPPLPQQQVQLVNKTNNTPVQLNVTPQLLRVAEGVTHYSVPGYN